MATPEDLARWVAAVDCYSAADIQGAVDLFSPMSGYSKISFNLGMLHLEQKDYKEALSSFDDAIAADKYSAIAHFQKAYIHFLRDELGTAEKEYTLSLNVGFNV
jgi:Tfp pilus assembly protein PilF